MVTSIILFGEWEGQGEDADVKCYNAQPVFNVPEGRFVAGYYMDDEIGLYSGGLNVVEIRTSLRNTSNAVWGGAGTVYMGPQSSSANVQVPNTRLITSSHLGPLFLMMKYDQEESKWIPNGSSGYHRSAEGVKDTWIEVEHTYFSFSGTGGSENVSKIIIPIAYFGHNSVAIGTINTDLYVPFIWN